MDELAKRTCHVCGAVFQYGLRWCGDHGQGGLLRLCSGCDCPECIKEAKDKPKTTANDSLVAVGILAIIVVIVWLLSITIGNMGPGGDIGVSTVAGMALFGVGWWFFGKLQKLK